MISILGNKYHQLKENLRKYQIPVLKIDLKVSGQKIELKNKNWEN